MQDEGDDRYASYHTSRQNGLVPPTHVNAQLSPKELVMGIRLGEQARAYPLRRFTQTAIFTDQVAGIDLVVYRDAVSEASAVYEPQVASQLLSFTPGPMWTLLGGHYHGQHLGYRHRDSHRWSSDRNLLAPSTPYNYLLVCLGGFLSTHDTLSGIVRQRGYSLIHGKKMPVTIRR